MAKKRYSSESIIHKLREVEILQGHGKTGGEAVKQIGITEQTFYRWRKAYGGMRVDRAKRLKELEAENAPLFVFKQMGQMRVQIKRVFCSSFSYYAACR